MLLPALEADLVERMRPDGSNLPSPRRADTRGRVPNRIEHVVYDGRIDPQPKPPSQKEVSCFSIQWNETVRQQAS